MQSVCFIQLLFKILLSHRMPLARNSQWCYWTQKESAQCPVKDLMIIASSLLQFYCLQSWFTTQLAYLPGLTSMNFSILFWDSKCHLFERPPNLHLVYTVISGSMQPTTICVWKFFIKFHVAVVTTLWQL